MYTAGKRAGVHIRLHISGSRATDMRWRRLRCGQAAEQTETTSAHETGGDPIGQQVQWHIGGEDVRAGMAARQPPSSGQSQVWTAG